MTKWRLAAIALSAGLVTVGCGGISDAEQALIQSALDASEELTSVDDVDDRASELCAREPGEVVVENQMDLAILNAYCAELSEGASTVDDLYLGALDDAGLRSDFAADRAALAIGRQLCDELDGGRPAQGSESESIAVKFFCPDYEPAFEVLQIGQVSGLFIVEDSSEYRSREDGSVCEGEGGYGDLNASTAAIIRDNTGQELARTELGIGSVDGSTCRFRFNFSELIEGAPDDVYVLEVGDRGEISYSFSEITRAGAVELIIG